MKRILSIFGLMLALAFPVRAQYFYAPSNPPPSVELAWNASITTNPIITNYFIYAGTNSLQYTLKIATGTNLTLTFTNLTPGVTEYFNVTAAGGGLESTFAGETNWTPPLIAPPSFKPFLILTVQSSPSLATPDWQAVAALAVAADQDASYFRTALALPPPDWLAPAN